jgi:hypothetical protein
LKADPLFEFKRSDWPVEDLDDFSEFPGVGDLGFSFNTFSYFYDDAEQPMSSIAFRGPGIAGYGYNEYSSSRSGYFAHDYKQSFSSAESAGMRENGAAQDNNGENCLYNEHAHTLINK